MQDDYSVYIRHEIANYFWVIGLNCDCLDQTKDIKYIKAVKDKTTQGVGFIEQWHRFADSNFENSVLSINFTLLIYTLLNTFQNQGYESILWPFPLPSIVIKENEKLFGENLKNILKELFEKREKSNPLKVFIEQTDTTLAINFVGCKKDELTSGLVDSIHNCKFEIMQRGDDLVFVVNKNI